MIPIWMGGGRIGYSTENHVHKLGEAIREAKGRIFGRGPCHIGPLFCPSGFWYFLTTEASSFSTAPFRKCKTSQHHPCGLSYPPPPSLSSLHLLVEEFLVLEWREKKTSMPKYGSNLVNVYFKSNTWCVPWIFAYTYFGNKARWKECRVRKIDHKRKAGGCAAFHKVLCNALRHTVSSAIP